MEKLTDIGFNDSVPHISIEPLPTFIENQSGTNGYPMVFRKLKRVRLFLGNI
jgi:hypothetical protein